MGGISQFRVEVLFTLCCFLLKLTDLFIPTMHSNGQACSRSPKKSGSSNIFLTHIWHGSHVLWCLVVGGTVLRKVNTGHIPSNPIYWTINMDATGVSEKTVFAGWIPFKTHNLSGLCKKKKKKKRTVFPCVFPHYIFCYLMLLARVNWM